LIQLHQFLLIKMHSIPQ